MVIFLLPDQQRSYDELDHEIALEKWNLVRSVLVPHEIFKGRNDHIFLRYKTTERSIHDRCSLRCFGAGICHEIG